jgi:DNA-binding MurR/RpiR family transcriptional regulator
MNKHNNIDPIKYIADIKEDLPKRQKDLCNFILENHANIGLMTVRDLSENAHVGISTINRVVNALGYKDFNELKKNIHEKYTVPATRFASSQKSFTEELSGEKYDETKTLVKFWQESSELLDKSLNVNLVQNFQKAMDIIMKAKTINLLGSRPYKAIALYLEIILGEYISNVKQLSLDPDLIYDHLLQIDQEEIVIVFAFEPYTNSVVKPGIQAHEQGNKVILITDHNTCPLVPYAEVTLKLEPSKESFSVVPLIALVEVISLEIGKRTSKQSINKLDNLKTALEKNNILYEN